MNADNIHAFYPDVSYNNYTDISDETITNDPNPIEYYGDIPYDHLLMGPNPWGKASTLDGCLMRSRLLYGIIFKCLYIEYLVTILNLTR